MTDRILLSFWHAMVGVPRALWRSAIDKNAQQTRARVAALEAGMKFLYRNPAGAVHWAYPVTPEKPLHRVTFSTGDQIHLQARPGWKKSAVYQ